VDDGWLNTLPTQNLRPLKWTARKRALVTADDIDRLCTAGSAAKPDGKDERPSPPANSIVGQIDFILQEQLQGTPLETRGIYLSESPEGGVLVNIGLQKFKL